MPTVELAGRPAAVQQRQGDCHLRLVLHTAAPGSKDASKLDLLRVAGRQPLREPVSPR